MSTSTLSLRAYTTQPDRLFGLSDEQFLLLVHSDFKKELRRLQSAYSVGGKDDAKPSSKSPSMILYGENYDEVNRTLVGLLSLKWIYNKQYDILVANQPEALKLSPESFEWIYKFYQAPTATPDELYALITSIIVNDIGKDDQLARDYEKATGEPIAHLNHDMILIKAVKAGFVDCLDRLAPEDKADIIRGMDLGADFNFGQLAQAENVPACLASFARIKGHTRSFRLRFSEQLLDIAGAAGHLDWTGAKKLTQSNFDAYSTVYQVGMGIISEGLSLRKGYDLVLTRRLNLLREKGFRSLDLNEKDDRALARLLCMSSVADLSTAELYNRVWTSLENDTRESLRKSLNIDGSVAEPAVQATYIPALMTQAVDASGPGSTEAKEQALRSVLRYLCRVIAAPGKPDGPVIVIERNVLPILKGVVQSPRFREDPTIIETAPIPESLPGLVESLEQQPG
ncbi:uncharacterized protein GGS25DRAFT_468330 [Hypoxylon fragiforme]|uniref:uncharacterized protein n=1 Tax=Hypoxylon fragiforme TaxID=63214 RepID=UPI0020C6D901|nr:uncharacterized protein GGS25DRAFT_468330 [Hypoxylon fragiforme]KAI2613655.1 hypothetical protein GGS25DRAFT_468330 [Hypoxylon fragiforme]